VEKMIEEALKTSSVIAVVGLSNKTDRPSYQVAKYLQKKSYKIVPVNPTVSEVLGQRSYSDHESVPEKVDLVDVFRRSEKVLPIAEQAVKNTSRLLLDAGGCGKRRCEKVARSQ
jgi:predicted CoA-binding protein